MFLCFVALLCVASFVLGRYSHKIWKYKQLMRMHGELLEVADGAKEVLAEARAKEDENRRRWQAMINDISSLYALTSDVPGNVWTDQDDAFLASWSSAERRES